MRITHETTRSVSVGEKYFDADEYGAIEVPDHIGNQLLLIPAHGFKIAEPSPEKESAPRTFIEKPKRKKRTTKREPDDNTLFDVI